ncbi:thiosulfate oxidation carrier protein SoxY [Thioalkalicoccus limnaeus]|uniref:Thiosulfate oxidation carrier protein SoxY n=1 Tax=Thioalkalicoccus limnaeus TaxID=120681 RepID=A0ABV4BG49_9GAMM
MMNERRRVLLKGAFLTGGTGLAMAIGLVAPKALLAAWPEKAFRSSDIVEALNNLLGASEYLESDAVSLNVPAIAENGAVVPVTLTSNLPNIRTLSIVVPTNPAPLVASVSIGPNGVGFVSTRIKMESTGDVLGIVESDGQLYMAREEVRVTVGGCG